MEDQLRKTLNDLEKREKKLVVNEQEVCFFFHIYTERIIQVQSFSIQSLYPLTKLTRRNERHLIIKLCTCIITLYLNTSLTSVNRHVNLLGTTLSLFNSMWQNHIPFFYMHDSRVVETCSNHLKISMSEYHHTDPCTKKYNETCSKRPARP